MENKSQITRLLGAQSSLRDSGFGRRSNKPEVDKNTNDNYIYFFRFLKIRYAIGMMKQFNR
jgi:hypothetical protein